MQSFTNEGSARSQMDLFTKRMDLVVVSKDSKRPSSDGEENPNYHEKVDTLGNDGGHL